MKRAGIQEIAAQAKVSIGTVDRALHGRDGISEATREKVLRVAKQLGYEPNLAARALKVGRANLRIGVCIPQEIHFFYDQVRAGIFDEAKRQGHWAVEILYKPVPSLGEGEAVSLRELLASSLQGLIVTPGNPKVVDPIISRAEEDGVRVVCTTTDAPESGRSAMVAVEPRLAGSLAAELLAKFLPPGSSAIAVTGMLRTVEHRLKTEGFSETFRRLCKGGKVAGVIEGHEAEQETYAKTRAMLEKDASIRGIYVSTVNCLPVCQAISELKLKNTVKLITTDLFAEMVPYIKDGTIAASIYQRPYVQGQLALRILIDHLVNGIALGGENYLNPSIALLSNLSLFRETAQQGRSALTHIGVPRSGRGARRGSPDQGRSPVQPLRGSA
jgi:LacI family transcriptional regulator